MSHSSARRSQFGSLLSTTTNNRKKLIAALGFLVLAVVVFRVSVITVRSHGAPVGPVSSPTVAAADELEGNVAVFNKLFPTLAVRESENEGFYRLLHHRWVNVPLAPVVTASKTDALVIDGDGDLQADPGDTLEYTVTINAAGEDATGVTFTDTVDPNTAFVGGSLTATPVAVNDSYQAIGNVRIQVPAGSGVLVNDFLGLPNATITGAPTNSVNGGNVTLNADGSFIYNPAPGFEGSDSFTYTLTNSEGSNNATVSITVSGMIWFVNSAAGAGGDGRLTSPFNCLVGAGCFDPVAADDPGDNIFLYSGSYTGGLTLLNNQRIIGQGAGASIASITGITVPSFSDPLPATGGTRPTVANAAGNNIVLGSGNYLRGFDIGNSAASGSAISGTGIGTLTVTELAISGTGRALNLDTGTLGVTIDSISSSNSTTNGVTLNNVGGVFSVTGSTTVTNATQEGIKISNISNIGLPSFQFGAVTIASRNATGILLDEVDNSGGTMSFGATSIPNPNAAGGYGIRVEDSSAPVLFASATISDANVVTAQSDGDANGIPDTDGDGDAIFLKNNSGSFTLNGGSLSNCGNDCIDLRDSSALVLSSVNISLPGIDIVGITGAGFGGHGISAINLTGTSSITGGTVSGWNVANKDGLYLVNTTSTALSLTVHGATFQNSTGNRGIGIQGRSAANMDVTVGGPTNNVATNCTFSNISGTALQSSAGVGAGSTATVNLTVQNSTFQTSPTDGKTNLIAGLTEAGKSNVVIRDNTFNNVFITASTGEALININQDGTLAGNQLGITIQRNNINNVGSAANNCAGGAVPCRGPGNAILVFIDDQANVPNTVIIDDNTLTNVQQGGIFLDMNNAGANASDVAARIINNCIGRLRVGTACTGATAAVGLGAAGRGIGVDRRATGGKQANVLIDGNTVRNGNGGSLGTLNTPGIFARAQGTTNSSVTLTNNDIDTTFIGGAAEMRLDSAGTATQCSDISGNTFPAGAAAIIDINEAAGSTHNVEQASAAAVQAANGGLVTVTPDAGVAFGVACAAPPMARLFNWSNRDTFAMVQGGVKAIPQAKAQSSRAKTAADRNVVSRKPDKLHHASVRKTESATNVTKSAEELAAKQLNAAVKALNSAGTLNPAMVADVNLAIGTLPAGESVTITFRVTVDDPFLGAMAQVSNQGTVSGTNFADVLTDDPTVGGTADPTVTPIDLPEVSVAVSPASVLEDGATNLQFTFTREAPTTNAMTVNFSIGGTATFGASPNDYTQSGAATFSPPNGTVTFAAGSATAIVTIDPEADTTVEPDETVILTVTSGVGYAVGTPSSASGTITNDDTDVSVAVSPASVAEDGATNLTYTFTRVGVTTNSLTVNFSIAVGPGEATFPTDYSESGSTTFAPPVGSVTFGAGNATAQVTIDPVADSIVEPDETVIFTVTSGTGYNVGSPSTATGTITNDDAEVTVAVSPASVTEDGATNLVYTFTRTGFTAAPLLVSFSVGGTAVFSEPDYSQSGAATYTDTSGTVLFGAGNATAQVTIDPTADANPEPDETVILTVTAGAGYTVGTPSSATGTILNDDTLVSVAVSPLTTAEGGANLVYTFTRTGSTASSITVNFSVGGTAAFPADYSQSGAATFTPPTATVTIGAGNSSAAVNVTPLADCVSGESPETVQFTVQPGTGYGVGSPSSATGTITDVPDTTAPVITLDPNRPMSMWPPDHDYQSFSVTDFVQSASDNCDPNVDVSDVYITKITSDEAENGAGDGNTLNDITIAANCKDFQLRAERSVVGNGRVYTIHFKVVDSNGNVGTATATVFVPLSFGGSAVDSGPVYTVMSVCP